MTIFILPIFFVSATLANNWFDFVSQDQPIPPFDFRLTQNSKFDENMNNHDRNVILREAEEVEGQSEEVFFITYTRLPPNILPLVELFLNLLLISRQSLKLMQNYLSTHYTAPRMVIAASGNVKHAKIVAEVKKPFTKLSDDLTTAIQLGAKEPTIFTD